MNALTLPACARGFKNICATKTKSLERAAIPPILSSSTVNEAEATNTGSFKNIFEFALPCS